MPLRTIIGVVADVRKTFLPNESPDVFVPYAQNPRSYISIVVRTDRPDSRMVDSLRRLVAGVDPALALSELEPMSDAIERQGGPRRGLTVLLGGFAAFAMALSALGLYASLAYTVIQRRSEFAIRMAIGASASSIVGVIMREAIATAAIGIAMGVAASLALGRVLTNQVYGIGTGDPLTLVAISVILAMAVLAACVVPGLRAARTDPMLALRE
jgi:putative ABC transport system permease protein